MDEWKHCRKILCVRADNMGDVIMSGPAIRAVKASLNCSITLLTSSMGSGITAFMPEIDETIIYNFPWVKHTNTADAASCEEFVCLIRSCSFDAAIIFTVYSQNPLPAALLLYMAGIPLRLAYCRENPYDLLTHWIPDKEPYSFIQHQVERDLFLVQQIGAEAADDRLQLNVRSSALSSAWGKLSAVGYNIGKEYIIAHPGVSEEKRTYPVALWAATLKQLYQQTDRQIIITGTRDENERAVAIQNDCGSFCLNACGLLTVAEFIALIASAALVISVNTATVHIACAVKTPVVVLYAQTNPQHTPWKTPSVVLPFSVPLHLQSRNEVIRHVNDKLYQSSVGYPVPHVIVDAAVKMLEYGYTANRNIALPTVNYDR